MAGVQIGLRDLYYAILTKDDSTGVAYQTPVLIAGAINAKISPKSNTETLYADDGPAETATSLGDITIELEAKDLTLEGQAALLGHTISGGVIVKKSTDIAPYVAIGFKSLKSNGKYRYIWLLKGKFQLPENEYKTQEDKPEFQTAKITGSFVRRDYDNAWQKIADEDHPDYVPSVGANWFTSVEAAPAALTLTTTPTDGATAVPVGTNIIFTFSNPINVSQVTSDYFYLMKAADGTVVPAALSIDATHKIITLDPTADLAAATAYIAVASGLVTDIYGQKIPTTIVNFTTA